MEKTAKARQRQQRKEPEQEALVRLKDQSNDRMSKLIDLYKAVIKGVNGGPSPGVGVNEKFNLTSPMPDSVPSAAQQAAQEAANLADFVRQIDQAQDSYSAGKTEKMQQRLQQMQARMQEMQSLQEQVQPEQAQAAMEAAIQKQASNRLTRLWSHITPFSWGEKGRSQRLSMLRALARVDSNLKDVENAVLGGDPNILDAVYLAKQLWDDVDVTFFQNFGNQLSKMTNVAEAEADRMGKKLMRMQKELQDLEKMTTKDDGAQDETRTGPVQVPKGDKAQQNGKAEQTAEQTGKVKQTETPPATTPTTEEKTLTPEDVSKIVSDALKEHAEFQSRLRDEGERTKIPKSVNKGKAPKIEAPPAPPADKPATPPVEPPAAPPADEKDEGEKAEPVVTKDEDDKTVSTEPPPVEKKRKPKAKPRRRIVEVEKEPEAEPEKPKDPVQALDEYTGILMANASQLYKEIGEKASAANAPEFWADRVYSQWDAVKETVQALQQSETKMQFTVNYLKFVKAVGDVKASVDAMEAEMREAASNPEFEIGSTFDEQRLEQQARTFLETQQAQLKSVARLYDDRIVVYANTQLSRFVKRMLQHVSGGRDKAVRLRVDEALRASRKALQDMLNNLERKNINFRSLISSSESFLEAITDVYDKLSRLASMYNSRMRIEKSDRKVRKDRMPYDLIPTTDINDLKKIKARLSTLRDLASCLEFAESQQFDLQQKYDAAVEAVNTLKNQMGIQTEDGADA